MTKNQLTFNNLKPLLKSMAAMTARLIELEQKVLEHEIRIREIENKLEELEK